MGGSRRHNRCRHVADRTSAAIFVLGLKLSNVGTPLPAAINLGAMSIGRLAHGCVLLQGGSTTGSAIGARIKPMML
jgi:hypothetical protein